MVNLRKQLSLKPQAGAAPDYVAPSAYVWATPYGRREAYHREILPTTNETRHIAILLYKNHGHVRYAINNMPASQVTPTVN